MKMRNGWMVVLLGAATLNGYSDPMRPMLTRENRLPEVRQLELGVETEFIEKKVEGVNDESLQITSPTVRYGLAPELIFALAVPGVQIDNGAGHKESGLGDVRVGLEFLAWEDIFHFPYLLPYVEATLPTGDEEKGLGTGDSTYQVGIAVGTTVNDTLHYALDVGYRFLQDEGNIASIRGALIYDLSKKTSILVEGEVEGAHEGEEDDRTILLGGLTYKPTPKWFVGLYGGTHVVDGSDDPIVAIKAAYTFKAFAPR